MKTIYFDKEKFDFAELLNTWISKKYSTIYVVSNRFMDLQFRFKQNKSDNEYLQSLEKKLFYKNIIEPSIYRGNAFVKFALVLINSRYHIRPNLRTKYILVFLCPQKWREIDRNKRGIVYYDKADSKRFPKLSKTLPNILT